MTSHNINFQVCGNLVDVIGLAELEEVRPSKGPKTGGPRLRSQDVGVGQTWGPHLYTDFLYF